MMHSIPVGIDTSNISSISKESNSSKNLEKLNMYLERKDYEPIIKDPDLFWLAYCKAILPHQKKEEVEYFFVSIVDKNVSYLGKETIIKKMQNMIEEIRKFLLEGLESKINCEILVIEDLVTCYLRKESPLIDLTEERIGYSKSLYHTFIKPALPNLAEFCGAIYAKDTKNQLVKQYTLSPASIISVEVIQINWQKESWLVYPIPPKLIPQQEEMGKALYSLYQKQQLCDFSLVSKDNIIQVHSSLLYIYGGPVLQKLLTSDMKETIDKVISLADYSHTTVQAFIEFIYLGGKGFSEKVVSSNNQNTINLFELFELANAFQIENLIDCCTNLITLVANKQDLKVIQHLASLYGNKHLEQLCEHLSSKENAIYIKV